jgi:hypothetical protein
VSDCCLTSTQQFCSAIWWREQVNFQWNDDEVCFLLDQHAYLDLYSASSLKQQSADRLCHPTRTHYPDSEPTCICSSSLVPCAYSGEATNTNWCSNPRSTTLEASTIINILVPLKRATYFLNPYTCTSGINNELNRGHGY